MIEIDHTAPPKPEPARPILASHLLAIEEKQRKRFAERGERIKTGCEELDGDVLCGGFERGVVVGISGEGNEGRLISLNLLTTILLSHLPHPTILPSSKPKATIIDTTGSFPLSLLASILKSRLVSTHTSLSRNQVTSGNHPVQTNVEKDVERHAERDVEGKVQKCLEMVAISRVFDVEGLWEVFGEVGRVSTGSEAGIGDGNPDSERHGGAEGRDSTTHHANEPQERPSRDTAHDDDTEIVIIDNVTHIITELFSRKEKSEAHTLLTLLSRTLHSLSQSLNILTLLHNGTVASKPSHSSSTYTYHNPARNPHQPQFQKQNSRPQQQQFAQQSLFTGNPLKPALGRIFAGFVSLHIFLLKIPRGREDAEVLYAGDGDDDGGFEGRGVRCCTIVEILKDETPDLSEGTGGRGFGKREQRWAALEIGNEGLHLVSAFPEKGTRRGLGLERESERVKDVDSVAKLYGFGGRRV